jgi:Na+-driven multidrug efflux pump
LVLGYAQAVINFAFITSFDDATLLSGLGLGMSFYVVFYSSFMVGMCSTITTFASQLRGMGQVSRSGIYLNGGRIITTVLSVPIMLILWFSYDILIAMGQNA